MPLEQADRLLSHLPAILQEDPYLGKFLAPFEEILLELEQTIGGLSKFFDPQATPAEFLDWLAGWVAFTLRADLDEIHKRDFISRAVTLFRLRGTRKGVEMALQTFTRLVPAITEGADPAKPADFRPHYFHVLLRIADPDPVKRKRYVDIATAILEIEKPAHTYYTVEVETPAMQINVHSTIGVDTLLSPPH